MNREYFYFIFLYIVYVLCIVFTCIDCIILSVLHIAL